MSDTPDRKTSSHQENEDQPKRRFNPAVIGIALGLIIIIALGVFFAFKFVENERERDLQAWQIRLGIVSDSRTAAVAEWIDGNFASMRELVENASLQLYMTELFVAKGDSSQVTDEPAQAGYLRNLLIATAERSGFSSTLPTAEVAANLERVGVAGIALVDPSGRLLVATPGMPPPTPNIRALLPKAIAGEPVLIDMYTGASGLPSIGFMLPVFALQGDETEAIGVVIGIRAVGEGLFNRLKQPGETAKSAESYLARKSNNTVEYLTPLADGTPSLKRKLTLDTPDLAAAYVVNNPGGFGIKRDYAGKEVLVTSRTVPGTPWVLVRKIDRAESLSETDTRLRTILIVFILIIVGVTVAIIAVWRHGSSLRAAEAAEKFRISSEQFENLSKFMNLVTNSQPTAIVAVDEAGTYTFANKTAADVAGMEAEDMLGKNMTAVIGPIKAARFIDTNKQVIRDFKRVSDVHVFDEADGKHVFKSEHIPLRGDRDHPPGCLMILDDITELTRERERRERVLRQLVQTLVSVVDRRDPYSANHSSRVSEVARAIAHEMTLSDLDQGTVEIAGSLMNVGKIFIPPELLTKTSQLTEDERKRLTHSFQESADLLDNVEFDGPVVETIRELGETWDGRGPLGLREEEILKTARIVAVANDFVGMLSPRAYRAAHTFEKVSSILLELSGKKYDRKAVSALINYLENRGGREQWAHYREQPEKTDES
ncbi:MAG: PAS domain-containing protein [Rhodospirillales bacterium]|nr:PAS domain-containing protein [Rhodospirillales bacterium]MCW9038856.1 PAS domain-containing protein [Rhodospirillales bacterium]